MNIYALAIGVFIVVRFKKSRLENKQLAYPILLASFPLYYFAFAVYANDITVLYKEISIDIIFFGLALAAILSKRKLSAALVGTGYIAHAIYDAYHDVLFINPGIPSWWLEFCGSIDLILSIYLFYFAFTTRNKSLKKAQHKAEAY